MLFALMLLAVLSKQPGSVIEATIRGTSQPLEVELLLRDAGETWTEVEHRRLAAKERRVRFESLAAGIYQVRVRGAYGTEQLATKVVVGTNDTRRTTIHIQPAELTGRITLGGVKFGEGALLLRQKEFAWRGAIPLNADGTFRAPLWQRGAYLYSIRGPALATAYTENVELEGETRIALAVDLPDGRITGIVRDAKSGAPVAGTLVMVQTNFGDGEESREQHVRLTTNRQGGFDFTGMKDGTHTVRVLSPLHLEQEPLVFDLTPSQRLRELDVKLDAGRTIALDAIDPENEPIADAQVFAVANAKLVARAKTDEHGRASIAVPGNEAATLFVVPGQGGFAIARVPRQHDGRRVRVHLPRATSSLIIRAQTVDGRAMPPFSLLMRYDGELVPLDVAQELASAQGLQLATSANSEAHLRNIPSGSYEFWPYRTQEEAESIVAAGVIFEAPILVNVRPGENKIAVKFAAR